MRINGCTSTKTRESWGVGAINRVSNELACRQMYGDKRGINFDTETVILRNKVASDYNAEKQMSNELRRAMPDPEPHPVRAHKKPSPAGQGNGKTQSTIGFFNSSSSKSKSCGNGFFDRLIKDMDGREHQSKKAKKVQGNWSNGIGDGVPKEKRASIERSLNWIEGRMDSKKESADSEGQPQVSGDAGHLHQSIRSRIGNLLMYDLPHEVTAELRMLARELEKLNSVTG